MARPATWAAAASVVLLSAGELLLADRKFGLFTGGFGMSRAVDTTGEIVLFALGYCAAQAFAALVAWALATRCNSKRPALASLFHFVALAGGLFVLTLAVQYQLHSYFSDAVSFTLMKQLGGGSIADALLFSKNEIGFGLAVLAVALLTYWLAWRWLRRRLGGGAPGARPGWRLLGGAGLALLAALALIPPTGSDAAYGLDRTLVWSTADNLLDLATDFDGDGYGMFGIGRDRQPFDPARHPLALDRPGDGIDEDGYGGDLKLVPIPSQLPQTTVPRGAPNLVMVVFESTRADVIGKRIDGRPVAPNLEALARAGSLTIPSYSHVGFTTESLKSVFSGALAPADGSPSLFRDLKASGYRIGVFSGQPEDFGGISQTVGMRANADVFVDGETLRDQRAFGFAAQGSLLVDESHLLSAFDRSFGQRDDWKQPVFLYFNFQSPHFPYDHPGMPHLIEKNPIPRSEITAANKERVRRTYWNAVAAADAHLGALIARLKALGVWDNTLLVASGDHGEELFDKGFLGHGHRIGPVQFRTFFVANRPGVAPPAPIALADYRGIVLAALAGKTAPRPAAPPFMQIGPLTAPTAIGLAAADGSMTSLRLDTGEACLIEQDVCRAYQALRGADRARVDALVARWGSERWAARGHAGG
jgi:hypothetical protein